MLCEEHDRQRSEPCGCVRYSCLLQATAMYHMSSMCSPPCVLFHIRALAMVGFVPGSKVPWSPCVRTAYNCPVDAGSLTVSWEVHIVQSW